MTKKMLGRVGLMSFLIPSEKKPLAFHVCACFIIQIQWCVNLHSVGARDQQEHVTSNQLLVQQEKAEAMYQRISEFLQILGYQWGSPNYGVVT